MRTTIVFEEDFVTRMMIVFGVETSTIVFGVETL